MATPYLNKKVVDYIELKIYEQKSPTTSKLEEEIARGFRLGRRDVRQILKELGFTEKLNGKRKHASLTDGRLFEGNGHAEEEGKKE